MAAEAPPPSPPPRDLLSEDLYPTHYLSMELKQQIDDIYQESNHQDDIEDLSLSTSIVESVLTADGIHDVTGFHCICMVVLIGDMSRGVMFPSMWPLVETLGGDQVLLGYSVAAFSFGRVLVNPLFGSCSHHIGYSKTLLIACSILLLGTLLYAQIQNVGKPEFLIVAQTVLGIGSGTLGVTRAFVADVTAKRNRTTYMAWLAAVQYGGFTVTPVFGALFNKILGDSDYRVGWWRWNMFTAPAYFMAAFVAATIIILLVFFKDRQRISIVDSSSLNNKKSKRRQAVEEVATEKTITGLSVYACCILGCMLLNVATKGSMASFETLGIAIANTYFDIPSSRAGFIVGCCGALGVCSLLSMGQLSMYLTDVQLISGGMIVMTTGILSLAAVAHSHIDACPPWRFVAAIFLIYSIGYPIGHTAVVGIFSKSTFVACEDRMSLRANSLTAIVSPLDSCRPPSPRDAAGMVCISWKLVTHDRPYHEWLYCTLHGHGVALLRANGYLTNRHLDRCSVLQNFVTVINLGGVNHIIFSNELNRLFSQCSVAGFG